MRRFVLNSNDATMVTWVKSHLLHDGPHKVRDDDSEVVEVSPVTYGQQARQRLDEATKPDEVIDPEAALARLADMSADEKATLPAGQ